MSGTQRFFANDRNLIATATLTASSVKPVSGTVSETTRVADGYGTISLSGAYTGANDATFDLVITAGGTAKHVSQAEFTGSGNGAISAITATGLSAQSVIVECVSTGTAGQFAQIHLGDVRLEAKTAGAPGNNINVAITPSLTIGAKIGAIPKQINAGETGWSGDEWNLGQFALLDNGELPSNAQRIVIDDDTAHVYRIYKTWDGQNWRYNMTPPSAQSYREGAAVSLLTGTYSALVTQTGQPDETYSGHSTLYALLNAMLSSSLLTIDGAVINDKRSGGMGIIDVPWRTSSTITLQSKSGSNNIKDASIALTVNASAAKQLVNVECVNNVLVGKELWQVSSDLLGDLGRATTGAAFDNTLQFTVPWVQPTVNEAGVVLGIVSFPSSDSDLPNPNICLIRGTAGIGAVGKTLSLVYTAPLGELCDCKDARIAGAVSRKLLGLEGDDVALDPTYSAKLQLLVDYMAEFTANNTVIDSPGNPTTTIWRPGVSYSANSLVTPPIPNGHYYKIISGVTTLSYSSYAADAPYPQSINSSTLLPDYPEPAWRMDGSVEYMKTNGSSAAANLIGAGRVLYDVDPDYYVAVEDVGLYEKTAMNAADEDIAAAYQIMSLLNECLSEVYGNATALIAWDGLWTDVQNDLLEASNAGGISDIILDPGFLDRYEAKCDQIRLIAGIAPKKFDASGGGSAVWRDFPSEPRWVINAGEYLPAFTNRVYHTAKRNGEGEVYSTQEAAFCLTCSCEHRIPFGTRAEVIINGIEKTYLIGDKFTTEIKAGQSLITAGGVTAVDTLTWRVGPGFADYALTSGEPAYSNGGLDFQINRGGIAFAPGDKFTFDIENSLQFKWRKDAGAWSADTAIALSVNLSSGIVAAFVPGIAPSWVAGDAWSFSVIQPYSPEHVKAPLPLDFGWQWSTSGETLSVDLGSTQTITAVGILVHSLPAGATLTLWGGSTAGATDWTEPLVWRAGPILALFSAHSSRYLRLVIGSATGGSVGWLWVGQPLTVSKPGGVTRRRYEHRMVRDGGINPGARRLGSGWGATVEWGEATGWLAQTDTDALLSMIEDCKAHNDYPLVFLPTYLDTTEGMLVRIADDEIEIVEQSGHQPVDAKRRINMSIDMTPVLL